MKVISIITEKGGVGKTTTSIHLGASFAEMKKRVLIIDFDSQRNLSIGYKIPKDFPYTVKNFIEKTGNFRLTQKGESLFILAGDRGVEEADYKRTALKDMIDLLYSKMNLDYIIIDCPPRPLSGRVGLGEIALCASDYVLSPIEAEEYSIAVVDLSESDRYIFVFVFVTSLSIQYTFLCLIASIFWTKNKKSCGKMLC